MAALATVRQINTVGQPAAGTGVLSEALEWAQDSLKGAFGGVWKGASERTPAASLARTRRAYLDADLALVERCLRGEEAAWEDLVKIHTRRVYAICYRFTGSDQHAQDLTQEVFLRVFRSLRSFRAGEGSFTVWLTRLSRNLLIDNYRRTKLERATDSIEDQLPMLEQKTTTSARTDYMVAGREASELLDGALKKLS